MMNQSAQKKKIPGSHWFSEGGLSQYKDLEKAYSQFSIFVAASSKENYENIIKSMDDALKRT